MPTGPYNFRDSSRRKGVDVDDLLRDVGLPACAPGEEPADLEVGSIWLNSSTNAVRLRTPSGDVDIGSGGGGGGDIDGVTAGVGLTGGGTSGTVTLNVAYGTSGTTAAVGNDSRLSNARTPTSHAASHQNGGSDEVGTATAAANAIPKAGGAGTLAIGWIPLGSSGTTVTVGNDSRLSDARTPTAHAASHQDGGADEISITGLSGIAADAQRANTLVVTGPTNLTIGAVANGQMLVRSGTTVIGQAVPSAGTGDVVGPASSVDNTIPRFDLTTGKLLQTSGVVIADTTNNVTGLGTINTRTIANLVDNASTSVDNAIARFDGTGGKTVQNSAVTIADTTGDINVTGGGTVTASRFIGPATGLRETAGPTDLTMGSLTTGQLLVRSGTTIVGQTGAAPTGSAGGQLGGTYPNPDVRGIRETSGPTSLTIGAVADGEYLRRSGTSIIGGTGTGSYKEHKVQTTPAIYELLGAGQSCPCPGLTGFAIPGAGTFKFEILTRAYLSDVAGAYLGGLYGFQCRIKNNGAGTVTSKIMTAVVNYNGIVQNYCSTNFVTTPATVGGGDGESTGLFSAGNVYKIEGTFTSNGAAGVEIYLMGAGVAGGVYVTAMDSSCTIEQLI